jgi:cell division septation protein DedD
MQHFGVRSVSAALLLVGALAPATASARGRFPVPSCGWAPAPLVSQAIGDAVSATPPSWTTSIAPVLTCRYLEREPSLQLADVAVVQIEFREQQFVRPPAGAVSIPGLGSCIARVSCPAPGRPAWLFSLQSTPMTTTSTTTAPSTTTPSTTTPSTTTPSTTAPSTTAPSTTTPSAPAGFVKLEALEIEDGFNEITIVVDNPEGPVPVSGETASLERLARRLLPRFHWD